MPPGCLTVLAPIRPGGDTALRGTLRAIGDDINGRRLAADPGRPHVDFARSQRIHFARFAILDDPDRGPGRTRLLYASVYDGALADHLAELAGITSDLDAIWGACSGYAGAATFDAFISEHAHQAEAYYAAFRDETAASIRHAISVRQHATSSTPLPAARRLADAIAGAVQRLVRAAPVVVDVTRAVRRFGLGNVYAGASGITASLDRYPIVRLLNWLTRNRMAPRASPFSSVAIDHCATPVPFAHGDEFPSPLTSPPAAFREDVITQNQLTLVTVVASGRVDRLRVVMSAIDAYARRLSSPGSLTGISTIHFVRWLVIDNGRRLLFVSDYDNSWENYIDEFAEMILSGLDAIWDTALGYPPDGARDLPAFKRFLRCHQVPAEVFFSAYPGETVLNIAADTARARRQ
jgi:hypothetical protein